MQYIHFIGGRNHDGKLIVVALGLSKDPESQLTLLADTSPFALYLLGIEEGTSERLEQLKEQFRKSHYRGAWFKATSDLVAYIDGLKEVDRDGGKTKRVSVDLTAEDFSQLEALVTELGVRSKAEFFRKGLKLYAALHRYKAQGFLIQAVKGGKLIQFPNLDSVEKP